MTNPRTVITLKAPAKRIVVEHGRAYEGFGLGDFWLTLSGPGGRLLSVPRDRVVSIDTVGATLPEHEGEGAV